MEREFSSLHSIPYSKADSLPLGQTFAKALRVNPRLQDFISQNLLDNLVPQLQEVLDIRRVRATMEAIVRGKTLPPVQWRLVDRIPGAWRFAKERRNRVHAAVGLLRLLELNLYLSRLNACRGDSRID